MKRQPVQPILGIVAPALKPLTPSQRELVRRAGTYFSIQQQQSARRRARAAEERMTPESYIPESIARQPGLRRLNVRRVLDRLK